MAEDDSLGLSSLSGGTMVAAPALEEGQVVPADDDQRDMIVQDESPCANALPLVADALARHLSKGALTAGGGITPRSSTVVPCTNPYLPQAGQPIANTPTR